MATFRHALRVRPQFAEPYNNLGNCFKEQGCLDLALEFYRKSVSFETNAASKQYSNLLYTLHFHPGYDSASIFREHSLWARRLAQPPRVLVFGNDRSPSRRLRIGYVSGDFRKHVVGRNLLPLIREHDREKFEVYCYANGYESDQLTEQFQTLAKGWRIIAGVSDLAVAEMIRRDAIDILVDLSLHMARNRLPVFACKPAPIQVTYLGYCGTTGLAAMDYRLSDPYLDPPECEAGCYSEKTVRLPHSYWCYEPLGPTPDVSVLPALGRGHLTFGCLNNFSKVSEARIEFWMKILREVSGSRLLLQAPAGRRAQRVLERFAAGGSRRSGWSLCACKSGRDTSRV